MAKVGPDTTECTNCGHSIRVNASVCHQCGAENENRPGKSVSISHDPSNYETTVSDVWHYGVAACVGLWMVGFLLNSTSETLAGFIYLAAWIGLPLSAFFDMQYIRANSHWNPSTGVWIVGLAIPILNVMLGGVYLYRRHESLGRP